MASYNLSALLNSLRGYPRRETRQPNNRAVKYYLLNKGVPTTIAWSISMNELCYWTEKELDEVFNALDLPAGSDFSSLVSFQKQGARAGAAECVKPDLEDIQSSADCLGALCVDRNGQFCVNPKEGFAALSHVWSQGLGADDDNRGLDKSLLQQVFDRVEPLGIRWIWTDSLAIPGGKRALTLLEEELKGTLINAMADIYRQAQHVVILDALCLRLDSTDPVKVAVITCLGTWITRMWTYQEIKLATNAIIATKSGFIPFNTVTQSLKSFAVNEVGESYTGDSPGKYPSLAKTFLRLQRNDELGISLPDAAIGCGYREAWDPLDYARALFPTLGVEWKTNYDIHDAMHKVYLSQKHHATRLALFHGPPRASIPGWAPASFHGLKDVKIIQAGTWESRGMQRSWLTSKVKSIDSSKPGAVILELESETLNGAMSLVYISEQTEKESPESIELFNKAVKEGTAYLLTDEPLVPKRRFCRVGLLVTRFTRAEDLEAWVCLTLAIAETEETYKAERLDWLLLHENPTSKRLLSGATMTEMIYRMSTSSKPGSSTEELAQLPLHRAAKEGNVEECRKLLSTINVNSIDSKGWTALHAAAATNQIPIFGLLLEAGANINTFNVNGESPLVLAIDSGHIDAVLALHNAGADVNASHKNGFSPMCMAARKGVEMVNLLLALKASPSLVDAGGWTPFFFAIQDDTGDDGVLKTLLEAGADPNIPIQESLFPIGLAAWKGNPSAIQTLLQHGADPNISASGLDPPLYHAIESGTLETVRVLLDGGATSNVIFKNGWTPMMVAAKMGDHEVGRLLQANGAGLNDTTADKLTPLHIAAMNSRRIFFKWLVEAGANEDAQDAHGRTASDLKSGFDIELGRRSLASKPLLSTIPTHQGQRKTTPDS